MKDSAFENFSEKALEALDFARCQRADGSYYGTGGTCRQGTPADEALGKVKIMTKEQVAKASDATLRSQVKNANTAGFGKGANNSPEVMKGLKEQHDLAKAELDSRKGDRDQRIQKALGSAQKRIDKLTTRANAMKPGAQKDKVQSKIAKLRKTQASLVKTRGREGTNVPSRTEGFGPNIPTSRFD